MGVNVIRGVFPLCEMRGAQITNFTCTSNLTIRIASASNLYVIFPRVIRLELTASHFTNHPILKTPQRTQRGDRSIHACRLQIMWLGDILNLLSWLYSYYWVGEILRSNKHTTRVVNTRYCPILARVRLPNKQNRYLDTEGMYYFIEIEEMCMWRNVDRI